MIKPEEIQRKVDDVVGQFGKNLTTIEKNILSEIELLIKELELDSSGRVKSNTANLKKVSLIGKKLERIILSKRYLEDVRKFAHSFTEVASLQSGMYGVRNEQLSLIEKMSVESVVDNLTESGVKANITNPIKDMLVKYVVSGGKYTDMTDMLRERILSNGKDGIVIRYLKTYTLDSINTFSASYNKIISDIGKYEWFQYTGSLLETSREFCEKMVEKKYFHVSEIPLLIKGLIDGHQCELSPRTGKPNGMKEETTRENFTQLRGGWNCGHQIVGLPESRVPKHLIDKLIKNKINTALDKNDADVNNNSGYLYSSISFGLEKKLSEVYNKLQKRENINKDLREIAQMKEFKRNRYYSSKDYSIYISGRGTFDESLKKGEMKANLELAQKLVKNKYDVYMVPNIKGLKTADYILKKGNSYNYYEGKRIDGVSSMSNRLDESSKQARRVILDVVDGVKSRYIANEIKRFYEQYPETEDVILFKGSKLIRVSKNRISNKNYMRWFMSNWGQ